MFNVQPSLGVQSWCFRQFTALNDLLPQIKSIGLTHVELCDVHVNFQDESSFDRVMSQISAAGITVSSIGVQRFKGDPATEEKWFRFCKLSGATMISATFNPDAVPAAYQIAEKLAEKYDLLLGIHNHGGYDWLGNAMMLEQVFQHTGERIGLCLDTGWCLQAGEDPLKWADTFNGRLVGTHLKDFIFHRDGRPEDVVLGTGALKLSAYLAAVAAAPHMQTMTLEYEGDPHDPAPALRDCVRQVETA